MGRTLRSLLGLLTATAVIGATGLLGGPALVGSAAAATIPALPKRSDTSVTVLALQQRLVQARVLSATDMTGHYNKATVKAVERYQTSHWIVRTGEVDQITWTALVASTATTARVTVPGLDPRCLVRGRAICVDKTLRKLFYVKSSTVVQVLDARFGCVARTPTREGRFTIQRKSRHHVSSQYHVYMPYAMFFSGGQAVHWSKAFSTRGYAGCSHGCVNIRDKDGVRWLFDQMRVGDRVVVYRS